MTELGNHHLTVLYEFTDPDTEHLWLPKYKKRGNWTLCAFGLKKKKKATYGLTQGIKLESGQASRSRFQFSKIQGTEELSDSKIQSSSQTAISKIQTVKMLWVRQPRLFSR